MPLKSILFGGIAHGLLIFSPAHILAGLQELGVREEMEWGFGQILDYPWSKWWFCFSLGRTSILQSISMMRTTLLYKHRVAKGPRQGKLCLSLVWTLFAGCIQLFTWYFILEFSNNIYTACGQLLTEENIIDLEFYKVRSRSWTSNTLPPASPQVSQYNHLRFRCSSERNINIRQYISFAGMTRAKQKFLIMRLTNNAMAIPLLL